MASIIETGQPHSSPAESEEILIRLLNGFEVISDQRALAIPHVGSRLVAYLALQQRPVSRSVIAGVLWSETTQDKAQASLRSALWRVRRVCDFLIKPTQDCLSLGDDVLVDVEALLETSSDLDGSLGSAQDAAIPISWFSYELLPDWQDDWVMFERERFRLAALNALDRISARYCDNCDFGSAAEYALIAIRLEPLRESAHRALIRTHLAQGNLSEAARQFDYYRRLLRRELGVNPTPQMTNLIEGSGLLLQSLDGS